jgi:hypothetical protein
MMNCSQFKKLIKYVIGDKWRRRNNGSSTSIYFSMKDWVPNAKHEKLINTLGDHAYEPSQINI